MSELKLRPFTVALSAALLAACAVGPDYVRPDMPMPDRYVRAQAAPVGPAEAEAGFWRRFDDPLLTRLVDEALAANHDLRIAQARYDQARALLRQTRFDRLPTVTAAGSASDARASAGQLPGVDRAGRNNESYEAGIEAFWELDFFGRVRRGVQARRAEADASAADLAAAQVAVVAELARSYFELRGLQAQLAVARGNAENQRGSLQLVEVRREAGRSTDFDSARARAQLEGTLARIPALQAEIAAATHRICVLAGREPTALIAELEAPAPLPALPAEVAAGVPGELLRRRPDILAAERRLAASSARIGVATADLYPRFTLGGLIGSQAIAADALFERDSQTSLIALGIDWSFLDVGRVRARIQAADAGAAENLARYQQTVLLALEETETALARYSRALLEREHLETAAAASTDASRLARLRFEGGIDDFLQVLDAERVQLEAADQLAQSRTRSATALVALYRALAGGWPERVPGEPVAAAP